MSNSTIYYILGHKTEISVMSPIVIRYKAEWQAIYGSIIKYGHRWKNSFSSKIKLFKLVIHNIHFSFIQIRESIQNECLEGKISIYGPVTFGSVNARDANTSDQR